MADLEQWKEEFEDWWKNRGEHEDGSHDTSHFRRVFKLAEQINQMEGGKADPLILLAAAYFHDAVNPPKDSPLRSKASTLSADLAREELTQMDFPSEKIEDVCHAVAAHSFSANIPCETLEAKIIQDADRMEALGALGVARNMYVAGRMNSKLFHPEDPLGQKGRELDDKQYAIDHFELKLLKLPSMMQTEAGRTIAEQRAQVLIDFRSQLLEEIAA